MKKILLFATTSLMAASAFAANPLAIQDAYALVISNDGKYSASEVSGFVEVINNETGERISFEGDDINPYTLGQGNAISNDYIIACSHNNEPGYIQGDSWYPLSTPFPENNNLTQAITPDGSRICGSVGALGITTEDTMIPMQVPVVWNRNEDGTWSEPVMLPYPKHDYTGRVPQYVTAMAISDDGNTIAGQVVDYSGGMITLIYYTLNEEGEWEYNTEFDKLANPNHIEIPEDPGEAPVYPELSDYMTPEEVAAYNAAVLEWQEEGTWDYSRYPNQEDYATSEELVKYAEAMEKYQEEYNAWDEKFIALLTAIEECGGQALQFNCVRINGDGKTVVCSAETYETLPGSWYPSISYTPVKFDLSDGSYTIFENDGISPSSIAANGTIMGYTEEPGMPRQAMVYAPGATSEPVSLMEYFKANDDATYLWMTENMIHDFETYDMETYLPVTVPNVEFTGTPFIAKDGSAVVCAVSNDWNYSSPTRFYSYFLPNRNASGIGSMAIDMSKLNVQALRGGRIILNGMVQNLEVYSVDGSQVYSAPVKSNVIETGLSNGMYIVKAISANGAATTKKVVF